jgi:hypothetical protein
VIVWWAGLAVMRARVGACGCVGAGGDGAVGDDAVEMPRGLELSRDAGVYAV